jgi:hypothetical protein
VAFRPTVAQVVAIAACLVALGCGSDDGGSGGGSADEAAVATAARDYLTSLAKLDAAGVCDSLSPRAQQQLVAQSGSRETRCADLLRLGFSDLSKDQKQLLADQGTLAPQDIQVNGTTATGELTYQGQTSRFTAEKVNGEWKLASPGEAQITPGK